MGRNSKSHHPGYKWSPGIWDQWNYQVLYTGKEYGGGSGHVSYFGKVISKDWQDSAESTYIIGKQNQ